MECKHCGWKEISCDSCHSITGLSGWVNFTKEEIEDLISNLDQCYSEGYISTDAPAMNAWQKLVNANDIFIAKECK